MIRDAELPSYELCSTIRSSPASIHCIVGAMKTDLVLQSRHVRLEPLGHSHINGLVAAAAVDPSLYQWSPVPRDPVEAIDYIDTALAWRDAGSAVPFANRPGGGWLSHRVHALLESGAMGMAAGPSVIRAQ